MQQEHRIQQEQITLPIGSVVRTLNGDRYIVEALLGKGGSSAVYRVRDRHNKQDIFAIKELIDPDILARERFVFEAETLMHLDHEALPRVYRVFENEKLRRVYISFIGNVKTGGDLAGEFYVINVSSGQHTGEYGSWTLIQA
ncbi:MAG: hypothetical protein NVS4B11_05070 [Ktedonobacteraceae bacterium]